jgi:hypothetical protein
VVERILAYRARLLASVAKRLPSYGELQRAVGLSSLNLSEQPHPASSPLKGKLS